MSSVLPLEVEDGSRHLAVVAGLILLAVARGLWRGKYWLWLVALVTLVGAAVLDLLVGFDWQEALGSLGIAGLLVWQRRAFRARPDRPTLRRALLAVSIGLLVLITYALVGSLVLQRSFAVPPTLPMVWQELGTRLLLSSGPLQAQTRQAQWFLDSLSVIGISVLAYAIVVLLRPVVAAPASSFQRHHAAAVVARHGTSSLAPFALLPDKSVFFGHSVDGMLAYRVTADVAVVCGDPIAAHADMPALLDEFRQHCAAHGWNVCVYEAQAAHRVCYQTRGMQTLKIGEDAWIDVQQFTLKGKPIADVRHAVSKIERAGVCFAVLGDERACDPTLWQQMQMLAAVQDRGTLALQFSIGSLPTAPDPAARYTLALGADGSTVVGCCAWLPLPAVNGWALDVLLRHDDAPNGTMEYLIAQSLLQFQRDGAAWASLGVAPLADAAVDNTDERSVLQQGVCFLYEHPKINEMYRYKSLFFFKRKFVPQWRGVYLVYDATLNLPRVLYAVLKVHVPSIGPTMIADFLRQQGSHYTRHWRE